MKIREKMQQLNRNDPVERLVALAYIMGEEAATRRICDEHNRRISAMREEAKKHRYHVLLNRIIDAGKGRYGDMIYDASYAGDITDMAGEDEWPIP